jgi:hypothetical protein
MKYTILPWLNPLSASHIVFVVLGLLILYNIAERIFKRHNITMRRGTLALISNTVWPVLLNICFFTLIFWRWAFVLSLVMGVVFICIMHNDLKVAHQDELEGYRGLSPAIRSIRAEAFADLSIEEQMAYKKTVKPHKFYWWIWLPLVVVVPFLIVLLLEQLGVGDYLFQVVYFE